MGHDTDFLIALIALLTRCVLADYYSTSQYTPNRYFIQVAIPPNTAPSSPNHRNNQRNQRLQRESLSPNKHPKHRLRYSQGSQPRRRNKSTPPAPTATAKQLTSPTQIEDWSYSLETRLTFIGGSGGASSKTHFSTLSINRVADGYSPLLFQYNTKPVATLTLTLAVTSGVGRGTVQLSALYKFSGVYVTAFSQSAGDVGPARETLQIDYAQLSMQYGAFGPDGRIAKVNGWGWDIRTQRPL